MGNSSEQHVISVVPDGAPMDKYVKDLETRLDAIAKKFARIMGEANPLVALAQQGPAAYAKGTVADSAALSARVKSTAEAGAAREELRQRRETFNTVNNPGTTSETRADARVERAEDMAGVRERNVASTTAKLAAQARYWQDTGRAKADSSARTRKQRYGDMTEPQVAEWRRESRDLDERQLAGMYRGMDRIGRKLWKQDAREKDLDQGWQAKQDRVAYTRNLADAEGWTQAEKKAHNLKEKQLGLETLKVRKEVNAERAKERDAAKTENAQGNMLNRYVPGLSMAQRVNQLFPGAGERVTAARAWGAQRISLGAMTDVSGMGAAAGGVAGAAGLGAILGAAGLGLAAGGAAAIGLGEYGTGKVREQFAGSRQRLGNMEQMLRLAHGAGGVGGTEGFYQNSSEYLRRQGVDDTQQASAYAAYLSGRGTRGGLDPSAFAASQEASMTGVDANSIGRMKAAGGGTGRAYGLMGAGLTGDALRESYNKLLGTQEGAAAHGITYDTDAYTRMSRQLSGSATFGGGRFGGDLATQRYAQAGTGLAGSMRSSMSSMSEMAVMAEAAQGGGDLMQIIEKMEGMSPQQKEAALRKHLGSSGAQYAKFSLGESRRRAAVGDPTGLTDPGPGTTPSFNSVYSGLTASTNAVADKIAAQSGGTVEQVARMDANMELMKKALLDNLAFLRDYARSKGAAASWLSSSDY